MVTENIHTPTMEGIANSKGMGCQRLKKFQGGGGGVNGQISLQRVNFTVMSDMIVHNN